MFQKRSVMANSKLPVEFKISLARSLRHDLFFKAEPNTNCRLCRRLPLQQWRIQTAAHANGAHSSSQHHHQLPLQRTQLYSHYLNLWRIRPLPCPQPQAPRTGTIRASGTYGIPQNFLSAKKKMYDKTHTNAFCRLLINFRGRIEENAFLESKNCCYY